MIACESTRPLTLAWTTDTEDYGGSVRSNEDGHTLSVDFPVAPEGMTLHFRSYGLDHPWQSVSKGCHADLLTNTVFPDSRAIDAYLKNAFKVNLTLGRLLNGENEAGSRARFHSALADAIDSFALLSFGADAISKVRIEDTLAKLKAARLAISEKCGAGKAPESCLSAQRLMRLDISTQLKESQDQMVQTRNFLLAEKARLRKDPNFLDIIGELEKILATLPAAVSV